MKHQVTFVIEHGEAQFAVVSCLTESGECHIGCPVPLCEWDHPEEGCTHCEDLCDCDCVLHEDGGECGPLGEPCECATRAEHGHGDDCPHTFVDRGKCWLLPWLDVGDIDWLFADLREVEGFRAIECLNVEEHAPETWRVTYTGIDGERDEWWAPADPDMSTLERVTPSATPTTLSDQGVGR